MTLSRALKEKIPQVEILWGEPETWDLKAFKMLKSLGVIGFDVSYDKLNKELIKSAQTHGMLVMTFTILDPQSMLDMIQLGVDGMETDFPGILNRLMP